MANKYIHLRIKEIMEEKNIPVDEYVKRSGISRATLLQYETGTRIPNVQTAYRIAYFLGCTLDELIEKVETREN